MLVETKKHFILDNGHKFYDNKVKSRILQRKKNSLGIDR